MNLKSKTAGDYPLKFSDTMPRAIAEPFPYQSLPPELRLKILKMTLSDARALEIHEYYDGSSLVARCKKPVTSEEFEFLFQKPDLCTSLLLIDTATSGQAKTVLYGSNTFRFSSPLIMKRFLLLIGSDNQAAMRRVDLVGSILESCYVSRVANDCAKVLAEAELRHLLLAIGHTWRCNAWYDKFPAIVQDWMPVFKAHWIREKSRERGGEMTERQIADRVFAIVKLPQERAGRCFNGPRHPGGNANIWFEQCCTCVAEAARYSESKTVFRDLAIRNIREAA